MSDHTRRRSDAARNRDAILAAAREALTESADVSLNDFVLLASINTTGTLLESDRDSETRVLRQTHAIGREQRNHRAAGVSGATFDAVLVGIIDSPDRINSDLTVAVFSPALRYGFILWDDDRNLLTNPSYRGLGWPQIHWAFTSAVMGHWIPVTWLTFGVDHALWGMNAFGYHLTNILLHAANAALFYLLARRRRC